MQSGLRVPASRRSCDNSKAVGFKKRQWHRCSRQSPWPCCHASSNSGTATSSQEGPRCVLGTVRGGVLKLSANLNESHCGIVPLLDLGSTGLPFAANLEFVCACSSKNQARQQQPARTVTQDVVELVYVLSGHGHLVEASTGVTWPVHPGVSAVTWARSTYLDPASTDKASGAEPLAVLKFFLPMPLLSAQPTAELDRHQRQMLVQACRPVTASGQQLQQGILDDVQAVQLLTAAHARAWQGPVHTEEPHQSAVFSNLSTSPGQLLAQVLRLDPVHLLPTLIPEHMSQALESRLQGLLHSLGHSTDQAASAVHHAVSVLHQHLAPGNRQGQNQHALQHEGQGSQLQHSSYRPKPEHLKHSSGSQESNQQSGGLGSVQQLGGTGSRQHSNSHSAVLMARAMEDFKTFQLPKQTNKLAFVFDPVELGLSLSFGVEIFEPGHHTPLHVHRTGHELFFILAGEGDAYCDGWHIPVRAGDCIVFPPGTSHGLDNNTDNKLYAIQLMAPDDEFTSFVQQGLMVNMKDEDLCAMTARSC